MPIQIIHQDITKVTCDVIVNPTDRFFSGSGGADRDIHRAAGSELEGALAVLDPISVGDVAVTPGFRLPCKYIFHTTGPVWRDGTRNERTLLRACYLNALIKAKRLGAESIAFPLISSGTFGFPKDRVLRIAIEAIGDFLWTLDSEMLVYICVLDRNSFELSKDIALRQYLNESVSFVNEDHALKMTGRGEQKMVHTDLTEWIKLQDDSFAVLLLKLIDKKNMDDVECYKKANVSKQTFWKIKNLKDFHPGKPTILAFAIALELSPEETDALLKSAGYALSHNNTFDMIIEFYIRNGVYDIFEINAALYQNDQPCLGV